MDPPLSRRYRFLDPFFTRGGTSYPRHCSEFKNSRFDGGRTRKKLSPTRRRVVRQLIVPFERNASGQKVAPHPRGLAMPLSAAAATARRGAVRRQPSAEPNYQPGQANSSAEARRRRQRRPVRQGHLQDGDLLLPWRAPGQRFNGIVGVIQDFATFGLNIALHAHLEVRDGECGSVVASPLAESSPGVDASRSCWPPRTGPWRRRRRRRRRFKSAISPGRRGPGATQIGDAGRSADSGDTAASRSMIVVAAASAA